MQDFHLLFHSQTAFIFTDYVTFRAVQQDFTTKLNQRNLHGKLKHLYLLGRYFSNAQFVYCVCISVMLFRRDLILIRRDLTLIRRDLKAPDSEDN